MDICNIIEPGIVAYQEAWDLQRQLAEARAQQQIDDTLILLEHPHTFTLGRSAHIEHLLLSREECASRHIQVIEVDRGGDITYHGPGQLVAYPIRYLGKPHPQGRLAQADYVGYIRRLEEVLIRTIAPFGIIGRRESGLTGVWVDTRVGPAKIAAIGVRVDARGISTHGISLNITADLSYFDGIVPCGIHDKAVTSLWALMRDSVPKMQDVAESFASAFIEVFDCTLVPSTIGELLPAYTRELEEHS
jgi:lipoate-protein ligase B